MRLIFGLLRREVADEGCEAVAQATWTPEDTCSGLAYQCISSRIVTDGTSSAMRLVVPIGVRTLRVTVRLLNPVNPLPPQFGNPENSNFILLKMAGRS